MTSSPPAHPEPPDIRSPTRFANVGSRTPSVCSCERIGIPAARGPPHPRPDTDGGGARTRGPIASRRHVEDGAHERGVFDDARTHGTIAWSRRRRPGGARGTRRRSRRVPDERIGPEIRIGDDLGWWSVALFRDTRHRSRNRDALNSTAGRFGDAGLSARRDFKSPGYDAISRGATHHQDPPWSGTADSRFPRSPFRSKRRVPDDLERAMNLRRKNGQ